MAVSYTHLGSQREERLDVLTERIEELGLDPKDYWWYLDLRRYGGVDVYKRQTLHCCREFSERMLLYTKMQLCAEIVMP